MRIARSIRPVVLGALVLAAASSAAAGGARYFHVDDFSGLGGGYAPLEGTQSLWCGLRPSHPDASGYVTPPGYGNLWDETWQSCFFRVSADVTVSYSIAWDTEMARDFVYFQYLDKTGTWITLDTYTGMGTLGALFTIPASALNGAVRFRFLFVSDPSGSDQDGLAPSDGACRIDQITVKDGTTVINQENFEAEQPGDQITASAMWAAGTPPACSPPCLRPPPDMKAWWPLDEPSGNWAYDNAGPDHAGHRCQVGFTAGKVSEAQRFTMAVNKQGYALVTYPSTYLDLAAASFTIDAWIHPQACSGLGYMEAYCHPRPILAKRDPFGVGYEFFVDNDVNDGSLEGRLGVALNSQVIISAARVVADDQWQHVAVRIDRASGTGTFFHNGVPFESFSLPSGNTDTPAELHLGHNPSFVHPNCDTPP